MSASKLQRDMKVRITMDVKNIPPYIALLDMNLRWALSVST